MLSAEDLIAGGHLRHEVDIPAELLPAGPLAGDGTPTRVAIRPLTVRDLQRIGRAARDDEELAAALMIQQAVAEPMLTLDQVSTLPAGLARFLVERINAISGVSVSRDRLGELVQQPLARACFVLAKQFGWTPEDVSAMTVGQILMYLELAGGDRSAP